MSNKSKIIQIRVSEEEYNTVVIESAKMKIGHCEYIRRLIRREKGNSHKDSIYKNDQGQARTVDCHFRMKPAEAKRLHEMAEASGLSISSVLRSLFSSTLPPRLLSNDERMVYIELKRIGINVNQIAAVANSTKTIDELYLRENLADLEDVIGQLRIVFRL